jgi:hypothetical protein
VPASELLQRGRRFRARQSKPFDACLSWVAIESVMVAVVHQLTLIVQLVLAETKDFLANSDLQGRVESGNDPPPRTSLILNRGLSVTTS